MLQLLAIFFNIVAKSRSITAYPFNKFDTKYAKDIKNVQDMLRLLPVSVLVNYPVLQVIACCCSQIM